MIEESKRLKAQGKPGRMRILWSAMFVPGLNGRRGLPYVLVGKPGTAKTSSLKQLSRKASLHYEGIIASLRPPTDFMGMPVPRKVALTPQNQFLSPDGDAEATLMHYAPASFAVRAAEHRRTMLVFDEANTAPPAVQAAMLRLLFEGVCGELELPPGVRMLLAMNHTDEAAGGWDIAPPLANRVGWLAWDPPTPEEFAEYLMGAGHQFDQPVDAKAEEKAVDELWPEAWAYAAGAIAGFTKHRPNLLHAMPKDSSKASEAWPSPRTWDFGAHALAGSYIYNLSETERETAMGAFIGSGAYGEFYTWHKNADLPNPYDLLDGKVQFKHLKTRLDRTAAVMTSCTSLITDPNLQNKAERVENLWKLHLKMADEAVDISLPSVVTMCEARLMIGSQTAYKVLAKMEPVLAASGITKLSS